MNKHAYQVGVLTRYAMGDTIKHLKSAYAANQLHVIKEWADDQSHADYLLRALIHPSPDIPVFHQPLLITTGSGKDLMVVDLRIHGKQINVVEDTRTGEPQCTLVGVVDGGILRVIYDAIFTGAWNQQPEMFIANFPFSAELYGSTLASALTARAGLEPEASVYVLCAFHIFYATRAMHGNGASLSDDDKVLLARNLARRFRGDDQRYLGVLNAIQPTDLVNLESYCSFIANQHWSVRLNGLKSGDLLGMLGSLWYDIRNPKETTACALEFPPAFMSILYSIVQRPNYAKNSPLARQLKPILNSQNTKTFLLNTRQTFRLTF